MLMLLSYDTWNFLMLGGDREREEALSGHAFNLNVWWIYFFTIENVVFNIFNIFNVTS